MVTVQEIIESRTRDRRRRDPEELKRLPHKHAFIYGRVSTPGQVRDSRESIREIARLVDLARKDGYKTSLDPDEIESSLDITRRTGLAEKSWEDGEVAVDVRDLGVSGRLSFEDRQGLAELKRRVQEGTVGAVYLTEGVSRLSRDKDRVLPYQLLKLLKEHEVRIRTPEGIWNPAIERDWDYLAEEFEDAIGELRVMNRRMYRRKAQKAGRGEYVGEPVPPGFFLPVTGRKPAGEYEYGKMEPYAGHAELVKRILEEYVRQDGSTLKTLRALYEMTFPFFPPELHYMERLTSLRTCPKTASGYRITRKLVRGLATNPKMIGIWQWGDNEPIIDNHQPVVPRELFLEAYHLATQKRKPRGRTLNFEPLEWTGLLYCMNHREPYKMVSLNSKGRYICNQDYAKEGGVRCLDISGRYLNEPLTATVLKQLDLTPFVEDILTRMETDTGNRKLEEIQARQRILELEKAIRKWEALLPCCVDIQTGRVDREKEQYYWDRIREAKTQLDEYRAIPVTGKLPVTDYAAVRSFLKGLTVKWNGYAGSLRNRLLKLIIEKVELRGNNDIEATIFWKTGFKQRVVIHRYSSGGNLDKRWTKEEDKIIAGMFPSSSPEMLKAALPTRSWKAIAMRAQRLKIMRKWSERGICRRWTPEEDERLRSYYEEGKGLGQIADELGRSVDAVMTRVGIKGLKRSLETRLENKIRYEFYDLVPLHEPPSERGIQGVR
jgi:DNA invertase Pin-like site-specific DNA recombinase